MNRRLLCIILAAVAIAGGGLAVNHFRAGGGCNRPVDPKLVSANSGFGVRLLKELVKAEKGKNVFISPASVSMALFMTYNGADGGTKDAMAKTLGVQAMTLDQINDANEALLANLRGQGTGVEVQIANSIWARNGVNFKDSFMEANRRYYSAKVTSLPFDSNAISKINAWVSDNTHGKIPQIINKLDPDDVMVLTNAVYFAGEWEKAFDPKGTKDAPFTLSDGTKITVPMMTGIMDVRGFNAGYAEVFEWSAQMKAEFAKGHVTPEAYGIGIPYKNGRTEMWVVLPTEGSLSSLVKGLSAQKLEGWIAGSRHNEVQVSMPRFKLACSFGGQMKSALSDMGMGEAFDPRKANFSRLVASQVWISAIVHKTVLEVDEKGTVAAAVTAELLTAGEPMSFDINRPFLCLIRDNKTKAILFIGVVEDPR